MNTSATASIAPSLEDPRLILSAFSPATRRQLELTVNALSRAIRKAIRDAEKLALDPATTPAEQAAAWQRVEDRCGTMRDFVRVLVFQPVAVPVSMPAPSPALSPEVDSELLPRPELETAEPAIMESEARSAANSRAGDSREQDREDRKIVSDCIERIRSIDNIPEACRQQRRRNEREIETLLGRIEKRAPDIAAEIRRSREIMRRAA